MDLRAAVLLEDTGPLCEGGREALAEGAGVVVGAGVGQAGAQGRDLGQRLLGSEALAEEGREKGEG